MQDTKGKLYLIPSLLDPEATDMMAPGFIRIVTGIHHFFVENLRSARRFLKAVNKDIRIEELTFSVMDKHSPADAALLGRWLTEGWNTGVLSEAGYPCIADPGNSLVRAAYGVGARVVPLVGPNAMLMALAASGFNGQRFSFSGYLPVRSPERIKAIKELENKAAHTGETQIFMETPYRNNALLHDILTHCGDNTLLCVAADLTGPSEFIQSKPVRLWRKQIPDLHKRPAVFLLGSGSY